MSTYQRFVMVQAGKQEFLSPVISTVPEGNSCVTGHSTPFGAGYRRAGIGCPELFFGHCHEEGKGRVDILMACRAKRRIINDLRRASVGADFLTNITTEHP